MDQLSEYRERLLARYETAAGEFREAVISEIRSDRPARDADWSIHQIAVHTRDVENMVYGYRVCRTLEEENPLFEDFDGEGRMLEHYRADEPIDVILEELMDSVRGNVDRLRGIPHEAWARSSRHAIHGDGFTLQTWVERGLAHIEEHLKSVVS